MTMTSPCIDPMLLAIPGHALNKEGTYYEHETGRYVRVFRLPVSGWFVLPDFGFDGTGYPATKSVHTYSGLLPL